jgi:hypothetical protein
VQPRLIADAARCFIRRAYAACCATVDMDQGRRRIRVWLLRSADDHVGERIDVHAIDLSKNNSRRHRIKGELLNGEKR